MSRRASFQLQVEPLEGRLVLSVGFSTGYYTVSDHAGTATITLSDDGISGTADQAVLSVSGGTAVPGVDYTPETKTIHFAAGQTTQTVQVPVIPGNPLEGTRVVDLTLSATAGGPPTAEAYILITHNSDTTPPTVTSAKVLTKGSNVTGFVITFSKDMAPGPVQDVNNYAVANPRSFRVLRGLDYAYYAQTIPLKSATYDPATHSVTLTPAGKVQKALFFQISDPGTFAELSLMGQLLKSKTQPSPSQLLMQPSPITDTTGNPLDALGGGTPNGHFSTIAASGRAANKFVNTLN